MAQKFRAVLFDLDGTLIDSAPDFIPAVNQLRQEHQLPPLPGDCIRATVSNGARALVSLALNKNEGDYGFEAERLRLLELYRQHLGKHSQLFPGIKALLTRLHEKNIPWGIATNKPEEFTTPLLKILDITPAAACVICPEHVSERKPHPESIFLAANILDCNAEEVVYIGDHKRDIDCGNRAGATTIAALYGYIESDDKPCDWRANYNVISADEIWPLIENKL